MFHSDLLGPVLSVALLIGDNYPLLELLIYKISIAVYSNFLTLNWKKFKYYKKANQNPHKYYSVTRLTCFS